MTSNKGLLSYETLVHAIAGATGSVVGMATFYPLDTVRSRLQLEEAVENGTASTSNGNGTSNGHHHKTSNVIGSGTLSTLKRIFDAEGLQGVYRGVLPVLQSLCCSNFVYFYTFHGLRSAVTDKSAGRDLLLAALAGAVNVMLTTPLWVVNTRLKIKGTPYSTLTGGLQHVAREEGAGGLWAGAAPSLILVCNPALQFMAYEALKRKLMPSGQGSPSALLSFAFGAAAKAIATIATYPLQVAQARLRHGGARGPTAIPLLLQLVKQRGFRGLFRGLEAKLLQTVLTAALMFAAYERITRLVLSILGGRARAMRR